jgi:hypothetical protein
VSVFPVLLSFVPYPILERMIGHGRGNNSHNPNRHQHQAIGVAAGWGSNTRQFHMTFINRDFVAAVRVGQYAGYPTNLSA